MAIMGRLKGLTGLLRRREMNSWRDRRQGCPAVFLGRIVDGLAGGVAKACQLTTSVCDAIAQKYLAFIRTGQQKWTVSSSISSQTDLQAALQTEL